MSHIDGMLLRLVSPSEVEIVLSIAGEVLNIENQLVLMVDDKLGFEITT